MLRIVLAIAILALTACGAQETATTETPGAAADTAAEAEQQAAESLPQIERCLDLVRQTEYDRAVPACLEALELDPENQQVQTALDQATAELASLEKAAAAAQEAAGEAESQLEDTARAAPGMPGE
jgi:tetratricopeptide (TPR) repeat protein